MTQPAGERAQDGGGITAALGVAAILMFLAALPLVGLAFVGGRNGLPQISPSAVGGLAFGLILAAAGVEALRRRHYAFVLLAAIGMALFNAGYASASGLVFASVGVAMFAAVALLVFMSRDAFAR